MNRTIKAALAVIFIAIIIFSTITLIQNSGVSAKVDLTEQKIYTLSDGSKAILAKLNQPITIDLYYASTAAMKAPDAIRQFNDYYYFVRSLLKEYEAQSKGMVKLNIIDPRPYSDEEEEALREGLKQFQITEDESFFFGMIAKTQFGLKKGIDFFKPDRQNFVEYDISELIDSLITREKSKVGVLSSIPIMGDDVSGYMAQMMQMQGKTPKQPWGIVQQLKQKFEVSTIETDVEEIKDVDVLLVVHPKQLPIQARFAIDQFVLNGGRAIVCVDPYCLADPPDQQAMMGGQMPIFNSELDKLLNTWGLNMASDEFVADSTCAVSVPLQQGQRPEPFLSFLNLNPEDKCFNSDNVVTASLNSVRLLMSGALTKAKDASSDLSIDWLLSSSATGNTWKLESPYELMRLNPRAIASKFTEGTEPVHMGALVTGKFKSAFPNGVDVPVEEKPDQAKDGNDKPSEPKHLDGITETPEGADCAVAVFSDVDFISNNVAYQQTFFGASPAGDNATLLINTIETLSGSGDLIAIRSRGNFYRPFTLVDEIEKKAQQATAEQEKKIQGQIEEYQEELTEIINKNRTKGEAVIDVSQFQDAKVKLENKIRMAKKDLRDVKDKERREIEVLGNKLRNFNLFLAPACILVIAVILSIRRAMLRHKYTRRGGDRSMKAA